MSLEFWAILSSISAISTSFIITKAIATSESNPTFPTFFYIHLPVYFIIMCYIGFFQGLLLASIVLLIATAGCAIYLSITDWW